jgi:pimeloyl-ACP methyl ester carboxylesterase
MLSEEIISDIHTKVIPHATKTRIEGAGHLVCFEKPDETARSIGEFLERTYPSTGEREW